MLKNSINSLLIVLLLCGSVFARDDSGKSIELVKYHDEVSQAHIKTVTKDGKAGVAIVFEGTEDLHYYAKEDTAAGGFVLKVSLAGDGIVFGKAEFPKWTTFFDPGQQEDIEVYVGNFSVFVPIESYKEKTSVNITATINGLACTSKICLMPFEKPLEAEIDLGQVDSWKAMSIETSKAKKETSPQASYSTPIAFTLAIIAGLVLNVMPCVWPVLPIIITRIWNQAGDSKSKGLGLGIAFCTGILLFFACIAIANIILRLGYGVVFQWGDHFRNPIFVMLMTLLMVFLGVFMFGLFNIGIPASLTSKAGSGSGLTGSVGMGFLAALLATPCSFAILTAAFAWAQTQKLGTATFVIMLIGVGMALPYAILVYLPGLMNRLPKPGGWMERVKQGMGFLLLVVAVKLLSALPVEMKINTLYFSLILSFCLWMWGSWVGFSTPARRKWIVRGIALVIAAIGAFALLSPPGETIEWQKYDAEKIAKALDEEKPVLIKFTADWCATCSVVDRLVYKKTDVIELIKQKGVVAFKGDTTSADMPATIDLANKYKEPGVPVSFIYSKDGSQHRLAGLISKKDVVELLTKLPDATED